MANYGASAKAVSSVADTGYVAVTSPATTMRPKVYDVLVGSATTADAANTWAMKRCTTNGGTPAAYTELKLDPDSAAPGAVGTVSWATDPVDTADSELLTFGLNQRATFRWVAAPGGELIGPATDVNGLFFLSVTTTAAANHDVTVHWSE